MSTRGPFEIRFADAAREDLERLFDFLLERASNAEDLALAQHTVDAIQEAVAGHLARSPYSFRKAGHSSLR